MEPRIDYQKVLPKDGLQALYALERSLRHTGLELSLLELVRMRTSQINGCAFCIDMHSKDARAEGETEQRLYALNAWRETPFFSERERAALEWTEAVTLISHDHAPDEIYERVKAPFSESEFAALTLAIAAINSWNRIAISFRVVPGSYERPEAK